MLYEKWISPTLTNKLIFKYGHLEKEVSYINVLFIIHLWCTSLCFTLYFWILSSIWTTSLSARSSILDLNKFQNSWFFQAASSAMLHLFLLCLTRRIYLEITLPCGWEQFELNLDLWQLWGPKPSGVVFVSMLVRRSLKLQRDGYVCKSILGHSQWFSSETCIAAFRIVKWRDG